jgi:hypothetical protein
MGTMKSKWWRKGRNRRQSECVRACARARVCDVGAGRTFRRGKERGMEWRVHQITTCIPLCSLPTELMTDCFIGHMNVNSDHI